MNRAAIEFSYTFSYECDSVYVVGSIHKACLNYQFNEALNYGEGFIK